MRSPETVSVEQPDPYPAGKIIEVAEVGYLNSRVKTTWRPARVIRRDGSSWLVVHDDCKCWAWDDEEGQMRPARLSTYLRYPITRLIPPAHKAFLRAAGKAESIVWRVRRVFRRRVRAQASLLDALFVGELVALQPVDQDGYQFAHRAHVAPVLALDAEGVTFPYPLGRLTKRPDGRLLQEGSGELFNLVGVLRVDDVDEAIARARSIVLDDDPWANQPLAGSPEQEPLF